MIETVRVSRQDPPHTETDAGNNTVRSLISEELMRLMYAAVSAKIQIY